MIANGTPPRRLWHRRQADLPANDRFRAVNSLRPPAGLGRQRQFEPLSRGRSADTCGQAAASRVERQLQKFRRLAYISADVSFEGTAVCRLENRGGQQ